MLAAIVVTTMIVTMIASGLVGLVIYLVLRRRRRRGLYAIQPGIASPPSGLLRKDSVVESFRATAERNPTSPSTVAVSFSVSGGNSPSSSVAASHAISDLT